MSSLLLDLYGHQAWADAEQWRVIETLDRARDDPPLRKRLHHIHFTQRAFLTIVSGEPLDPGLYREFDALGELKEYAMRYHTEAVAFVTALTKSKSAERANIPWFRDPPLEIAVGEALAQAAMHSHYHRAQNAGRLRELGGEPPMTDLIVWYWKGKPEPLWP